MQESRVRASALHATTMQRCSEEVNSTNRLTTEKSSLQEVTAYAVEYRLPEHFNTSVQGARAQEYVITVDKAKSTIR
jgi:hypothetical protein